METAVKKQKPSQQVASAELFGARMATLLRQREAPLLSVSEMEGQALRIASASCAADTAKSLAEGNAKKKLYTVFSILEELNLIVDNE